MIVLLALLLACLFNLAFLVREYRRKIWYEGRFWVSLATLVLLAGTVLLGA